MIRTLLCLSFLLCSAFGTRAQGVLFQLNPPAPNAQVRVCPSPDNGYPCPVTAAIFSDVALTQSIAQPVSLGSGGFFSFYIASGTYVIQLSGPGYGSANRTTVSIGGGGSSSPSSLTTYFNGFQGLSPTDAPYNAKGDGRFFFDGNITATLSTLTAPTTTPFCNGTTVPCNGRNITPGMIVEIQGAGTAGAPLHTTIASVQSAGSATIVGTAVTTVTNRQVLMGDDDCTPLTNWANAIATAFSVHNGYLPGQILGGSVTGQFLTSCPVRIVNTNASGTNSGECAAVSGSATVANLGCPLVLTGAGPGMSDIIPLTAGSFNWGSVDTGVLFLKNWATGYTVSQIGVIGDQSAHVTTAIATRIYGCFVVESSSHGQVMQNWFTGCKNTSSNNSAMKTVGDFESLYQNNAMEASDYGLWLDSLSGQCPSGASGNLGTCNKIHIYTNNMENNIIGIEIGSQLNNGGWQQIRLYDDHVFQSSFSSIQMTSNVVMDGKEGVVVDAVRINTGGASDIGLSIQSGANGRFDVSNSYIDEQAGGTAVSCLSSTGDMNFSNTTINSSAAAVNNTACPFIHFMNGSITGTITGANAGTFFSFQNTAVGWKGLGVNEGTSWYSDQTLPCTNGELALSAGWQSTGSATVTAVAGAGPQTCSWTITTGTTTAANPTVTDTLTSPLPSATIVCQMTVNGGTHTSVVGAGTSDSFHQTTLSATAPVFTYQETPTAGGTTYFVTRTCGP